jgi:hypothetical protein
MSHPIDINSEVQRRLYVATASQTVFDVPFPFFLTADVIVAVDGLIKAIDTEYTLTGADTADGGAVTFLTALTGGQEVVVFSQMEYTRLVQYAYRGELPYDVLDKDFERLLLMVKQGRRDFLRSVHPSDLDDDASMVLPMSADRAGKFLGFDATGNVLATVAVDTEALTGNNIGAALWPRTAEETAAGVTPATGGYKYQPGDVRRYGAVAGEAATVTTTANTTAFQNALNSNGYVWWQPGLTYMTDTLFVRSGNTLDLQGATLMLVKGVEMQHAVLHISAQNLAGDGWQFPGVNRVDHVLVKNGFINGNGENNLNPVQGSSSGSDDGGLHGVQIAGRARNIHLEKLWISQCGTDGIDIGIDQYDTVSVDEDTRPRYVTAVDVTCNKNTRQGMSITDGDYLEFNRCRFMNTYLPGIATGIQQSTTLSVAAASTDTTITVPASPAHGFVAGDKIGISLDSGKYKWTTVNGTPSATVITLDGAISTTQAAAIGKTVWDGESGTKPLGPWAGVDIENYDSSENIRFTNCEFENNGGRGFICIPVSADNTKLFFSGCHSNNNGLSGSDSGRWHFTHLGGPGSTHRDVVMTNCIVEGLTIQGKDDNSVDMNISNCVIGEDNTQQPGLFMRGLTGQRQSIVRLSNCDIQGARDDQYSDPIDIAECNYLNLIITGGSIINYDPSSANSHAINLAQTQAGARNVLQLSGVYVKAPGDGIRVARGWDAYIGGNTVIEAASDGVNVLSGGSSPEFKSANKIVNPVEGATYPVGTTTFEVDGIANKVGDLYGFTQTSGPIHWTKITAIPDGQPKDVVVEVANTVTIADGAAIYIIQDVETQLTAAKVAGNTTIAVDSTVGFYDGDVVEVILDTGVSDRHLCTVTNATTIELATGLAGPAADNQPLYRYRRALVVVGDCTISGASVGVKNFSVTETDNGRVSVKSSNLVNCTVDTENLTGLSQLSGAAVDPNASPYFYAGMGSTYQSTGDGSVWSNTNGIKLWVELT